MAEDTEVKSICGAVKLLEVIGEVHDGRLQIKFGTMAVCPMCKEQPAGKIRQRNNPLGLCNSCLVKSRWTEVECAGCGKSILWRTCWMISRIKTRKQKDFYCSHKCAGKYLGKHYGFAVHPENIGASRKYDYEAVWRAQDETGFGCNRLSRLLNIPVGTISNISRKRPHAT